jgi:hypothetical protein
LAIATGRATQSDGVALLGLVMVLRCGVPLSNGKVVYRTVLQSSGKVTQREVTQWQRNLALSLAKA